MPISVALASDQPYHRPPAFLLTSWGYCLTDQAVPPTFTFLGSISSSLQLSDVVHHDFIERQIEVVSQLGYVPQDVTEFIMYLIQVLIRPDAILLTENLLSNLSKLSYLRHQALHSPEMTELSGT